MNRPMAPCLIGLLLCIGCGRAARPVGDHATATQGRVPVRPGDGGPHTPEIVVDVQVRPADERFIALNLTFTSRAQEPIIIERGLVAGCSHYVICRDGEDVTRSTVSLDSEGQGDSFGILPVLHPGQSLKRVTWLPALVGEYDIAGFIFWTVRSPADARPRRLCMPVGPLRFRVPLDG